MFQAYVCGTVCCVLWLTLAWRCRASRLARLRLRVWSAFVSFPFSGHSAVVLVWSSLLCLQRLSSDSCDRVNGFSKSVSQSIMVAELVALDNFLAVAMSTVSLSPQQQYQQMVEWIAASSCTFSNSRFGVPVNNPLPKGALKVPLLQGVEQSGADKLNIETTGKTGVKKRMGFPGTFCEPCACLSRLGGAHEDLTV